MFEVLYLQLDLVVLEILTDSDFLVLDVGFITGRVILKDKECNMLLDGSSW